MKKFWDWIRDEDGGRVLRLEGPIDADSFWGDEVTPKAFRDELEAGEGDVTVWINSEGGNVFAAAEIYTMLRDYPGTVTVRIASIAASAASVVAMAGDKVQMSPTAMLFLHDPSTIAMGNTRDMAKAIDMLNAVKESIISAYRAKTGLSRNRLSKIMEDETPIHAEDALKLGFCDEILFGYGMPVPGKNEKDGAEDPGREKEADQVKRDARADAKMDGIRLFSTKMLNRSVMDYLGKVGAFDRTPAVDTDKDDDGEKADAAGDNYDVTETDSTDEADVADDAESKQDPNPREDTYPDGEPPGEDSVTDAKEPSDEPPDDEANSQPVIGMDGKTKDGAMPYEILKNQLDFLK